MLMYFNFLNVEHGLMVATKALKIIDSLPSLSIDFLMKNIALHAQMGLSWVINLKIEKDPLRNQVEALRF